MTTHQTRSDAVGSTDEESDGLLRLFLKLDAVATGAVGLMSLAVGPALDGLTGGLLQAIEGCPYERETGRATDWTARRPSRRRQAQGSGPTRRHRALLKARGSGRVPKGGSAYSSGEATSAGVATTARKDSRGGSVGVS